MQVNEDEGEATNLDTEIESSSKPVEGASMNLKQKRKRLHTKLLKRFREQVEPNAKRILWDKVRVIYFPFESAEKLRARKWTEADVVEIEKFLPFIWFEYFKPTNPKRRLANEKLSFSQQKRSYASSIPDLTI